MAFTLASLARAGEILVDADVYDALESGWDLEHREGLPGLDDTVEAWTLRPPPPPDA
jgi:class 3 adenylate cyclase